MKATVIMPLKPERQLHCWNVDGPWVWDGSKVCCLCICLNSLVAAEPARRIPKVYNALITSNQNLEPSKSFPVYQPVLQNAVHFPYQPVVYGDYPLSPGFLPVPALSTPSDINTKTEETLRPTTPEPIIVTEPPTEKTPPVTVPRKKEKEDVPPPPPTESPIPLNEFGLPPQILPLGRINPDYALTHFNTFPYSPYSYPGFRLYDPYSPFGLNPLHYPSYPIYGPINNFVAQYTPKLASAEPSVAPAPAASVAGDKSTPPPEPSDLNVLNYAPKDPAIPNVPPPPLPLGGLNSDNE